MIHTTTAADWPDRPAVNHLNYSGDHRHLVDGPPLGPNAYSEWMHSVRADYDDQANTTRVGLTPIAPQPAAAAPAVVS